MTALRRALCDTKRVIYFSYASDFLSVKWKIVTLPLSNSPSFAKRTNNSFCTVLCGALKNKATSVSYRQCIYAAPGNGLSHAKPTEYSEKPGSYFSSYYLLHTLWVPGTVLHIIPSQRTPKELLLLLSFCKWRNWGSERLSNLSEVTQKITGFKCKEAGFAPDPAHFPLWRHFAFCSLLFSQGCSINLQHFIVRRT